MKKAPHIKNVFVTTETEEVFHNLTRWVANYACMCAFIHMSVHVVLTIANCAALCCASFFLIISHWADEVFYSLCFCANISSDFPDFNFYFTRFERNTHLHTSLKEGHVIDYQMDLFMSMSNLFVSIEADFFVGTLASGWCQMIYQLERTRGDGGTNYNAVDSG